MFRIERFVRQLKGIRMKPVPKPADGVAGSEGVILDEIGYEASSLLSQEEYRKKNRKS